MFVIHNKISFTRNTVTIHLKVLNQFFPVNPPLDGLTVFKSNPDCRVWQFSTRSRVCKTKSQVCRLVLQKSQVCKCADLVDKYIGNIFPQQANSFEHVDVLCGLETTLYNLPSCGAVNTISGNLGLQIFKTFLTWCQPRLAPGEIFSHP